MTDKDGGPAFLEPVTISPFGEYLNAVPGMSLRDWFASQALAGHFALLHPSAWSNEYSNAAEGAYKMADAMLRERVK